MRKAAKRKPVAPVQRRRVREIAANSQPSAIVRRPTVAEAVEKVLITGDLTPLAPEQRLEYYNQVCKSLGLNPLTMPFAYIVLNGKMILYARKDCTEQLRRMHGVSVTSAKREVEDDLCIVEVAVQNREGRTDTGTGIVGIQGLKQLDRANAMMKAETKAKRRATLSICGLGFLDETELDTISDFQTVSPTGRIVMQKPRDEECGHCGRALSKVPNGCPEPTCPLKSKLTAAQREVVKQKTMGAEPRKAVAEQSDTAGFDGGVDPNASRPMVTPSNTRREKPSSAEMPTAPKPIEVFYTWSNEHQRATFVDNEALRSLTIDLKRILTKYWDGKAVVMDAETFEAAKFEFETRNITLRRLLGPGEKP